MRYLRNGGYLESRLAFQTLVRTYPEDRAVPLGYWALGLSYYKKGGKENLLLALDNFRNYLLFFPGEKDLEALAEAAQINVAVIEMELMNSARIDKDKFSAAKITAQALTQFLKGYPDSPQAPAAQFQLEEIQWYLAGVDGK